MEGKFKLNQNRPAADLEDVIEALSTAEHDWELAVASMMRQLPAD